MLPASPATPAPEDLPLEVQALAVLAIGMEAGWEAHVADLARRGLGAVVPFGSALADPALAAQRIADLQAAAGKGPVGVPLLVGADEEGGRVARLPRGPASFPGAAALGAVGDPALCVAAGRATALRLAAVGIGWDLAPVCDLAGPDNPGLNGRAFDRDPERCGRLAAAFASGLAAGGAIACAKHFPGHGGTRQDSHATLPVLEAAEAARARQPFSTLIAAGVPMVMTGHLLVPDRDPRWPASLSPAAHACLRTELGFAGVVVTDSLGMGGCLAAAGSVGAAAVQALVAGADLILIGHGPAEHLEAHAAIVAAVREGRLPAPRLLEALGRVLALKARHGLARRTLPDPEAAPHLLSRPADVALARQIARLAVRELRPGPAVPEPALLAVGPGTPQALRAAAAARWPQAPITERAHGGAWLSLGPDCHLIIAPPVPEPLPAGRVLAAWDAMPASVEALLAAAVGGPA